MNILDMTEEQQTAVEAHHAPWGIPVLINQTIDMTLLYQPDYVSGKLIVCLKSMCIFYFI